MSALIRIEAYKPTEKENRTLALLAFKMGTRFLKAQEKKHGRMYFKGRKIRPRK